MMKIFEKKINLFSVYSERKIKKKNKLDEKVDKLKVLILKEGKNSETMSSVPRLDKKLE